MKYLICLFGFLFIVGISNSQTTHMSTGSGEYNEVFNDSKMDSNDGGTISVGSSKFGSSGDKDLLMMKYDANHVMLWQKTIVNTGDDELLKVKICTNGDYLVAGKLTYNNSTKAMLCRINSSNGDIIWTCILNTTGFYADAFYDMAETNTGMIAVVGGFSNLKRSYIALVDANGNYSTSINSSGSNNEFMSIEKMPNGNLLVAGYLNSGSGFHYLMMVELNPVTLARISQNRYAINLAIPGGPTVKSLWPISLSVRNSTVLLSTISFPATSSAAAAGICIYNYDITTRALSGNLYYQPGYSNATNYSVFPLTENDLIFSQTYSTPSKLIAVTRITNNTRVFDRKINGSVNNISSLHVNNVQLVCAGNVNKIQPVVQTDAYNMFTSVDFPLSISACSVSDINTTSSIASNINATSNSSLALALGESTMKITLSAQNTTHPTDDPCVSVPVLFTFTGNGNWNEPSNWANNLIPPAILPAGSTININPSNNGICILNIPQVISTGAHLNIFTNANFVVQGNLNIQASEVAICNQVWSMKNLDVTTYRNGDPIPHVSNDALWSSLTTGAYCYYNNDSATYAAIYGKLYNWYAVTDPRGLAPAGWHIPAPSEWNTLATCLGGLSIAGGHLKEAGFTYWNSPNTGATNSSRFTSRPSGYRNNTGSFSIPGSVALYWSNFEWSSTEAWGTATNSDSESLNPTTYVKIAGYAVRCVKD